MLKKISLLGIVSIAVLLSGCGSKPTALMVSGATNNEQQAIITVSNGMGVPSWAANESKAFHNVLEAAATATLERGYKYFAIYQPDEISNIKGSLANTAEELLKKCDPNAALVLAIPGTSGLHKCGTYNTKARLAIIMYHEEQEKFTVIDAQKVIDYMKSKKIYDDNGVKITK